MIIAIVYMYIKNNNLITCNIQIHVQIDRFMASSISSIQHVIVFVLRIHGKSFFD
jgi:hypothetical protein